MRYSQPELKLLDDVRAVVNRDVAREHDVFLCHAWDDREGHARELASALRELNVDVWFSQDKVILGLGLLRQLDAGLRVSRVGIVLVTPALLATLRLGGIADQELGALLATRRVIPVVHGVAVEDLIAESPLLAARAGLSTVDSSLSEVAIKIAESVLDREIT